MTNKTKQSFMTKKDWEDQSNILYEKKIMVKKFQTKVKHNNNVADLEQKWVDVNLQPLFDFFGSENVWKKLVPNVQIYGVGQRIASHRKIQKTGHPQAHFSSTHWTSRLKDETKWFDPYDKYQVKGTNQFCQTFALMYLCNELPPITPPPPYNNSWKKYYYYTEKALEFIKKTLKTYYPDEKDLLKKVDQCIKYPKRCVNCIELLPFE